jgi:hypothetical protein
MMVTAFFEGNYKWSGKSCDMDIRKLCACPNNIHVLRCRTNEKPATISASSFKYCIIVYR